VKNVQRANLKLVLIQKLLANHVQLDLLPLQAQQLARYFVDLESIFQGRRVFLALQEHLKLARIQKLLVNHVQLDLLPRQAQHLARR
jgi:hypothetical protein